jgi:conjugative transposon TraN protein
MNAITIKIRRIQICILSTFFTCLQGFCQSPIPSYPLSVTFQKTTNIIFPYRIEKADIGSADVISHKDTKLENVLFLKANRKDFVPTNLSVYTSDGRFYSFIIKYNESPDTLNIIFTKECNVSVTPIDSVNDEKLDSDVNEVLKQPSFLQRSTSSEEMKTALKGIYIRDHLLWFKIDIQNNSMIDYSPEYIRFFIRDKHQAKRTAVQETELTPRWQTPGKCIPGEGKVSYIFGFPAFTIARQKKLVIQVSERNGGRILNLTIPAKAILKSRPIQNLFIHHL